MNLFKLVKAYIIGTCTMGAGWGATSPPCATLGTDVDTSWLMINGPVLLRPLLSTCGWLQARIKACRFRVQTALKAKACGGQDTGIRELCARACDPCPEAYSPTLRGTSPCTPGSTRACGPWGSSPCSTSTRRGHRHTATARSKYSHRLGEAATCEKQPTQGKAVTGSMTA